MRSSSKLFATPITVIALTAVLCVPAQAQRGSTYTFQKISTLGDSAPGGGNHINDFETGAINNRGDVIYATDLGTTTDPTTLIGEGVFLAHDGKTSVLARWEMLRGMQSSTFCFWATPNSMTAAMARLLLRSTPSTSMLLPSA